MNTIFIKCYKLIVIGLCLVSTTITVAQSSTWKQYVNVEEAGFSATALDDVQQQLDSMDTASLLVVYKGNILFSHGDTTRKFMLHSIRKSIMNAMVGIEIEKGTFTLNQTLQELKIDDIGELSQKEKQATVIDLLSARSGVYHPSAYSTRGMIKNLPERGSHKAGSFWYYNNWDFNVLLTIYEQQSSKLFFEAFKNEIADPIGMEDFNIEDTFYRNEKDKSNHPAYLFKMSARDMARFGLLYMNNGKWNNKQLVSEDWIEKSTQPVSTDLGGFSSREAYGLLWWVTHVNGRKMYYASGLGGHRIMIFPQDDLIMVHRVNTYENVSVNENSVEEIAVKLLNAKLTTTNNHSEPKLIAYNPNKEVFKTTYKGSMDQYIGTYKHRFLGEMTIKNTINGYILQNGIGTFNLYATSENTFLTEDIELPLVLIKTTDVSKKFIIEPVMRDDKSIKEMIFYY